MRQKQQSQQQTGLIKYLEKFFFIFKCCSYIGTAQFYHLNHYSNNFIYCDSKYYKFYSQIHSTMQNNSFKDQGCYFQCCFINKFKNTQQSQPIPSHFKIPFKKKTSLKKKGTTSKIQLNSKRTWANETDSINICKKSIQEITRSNTQRPPLNFCIDQDYFRCNRNIIMKNQTQKGLLSARNYCRKQNKGQSYQLQRTKSNLDKPFFRQDKKNLIQIRSSPNFKNEMSFLKHMKQKQFLMVDIDRLYSSESIRQVSQNKSQKVFYESDRIKNQDSYKYQLNIQRETVKSVVEQSIIQERESESFIQIDFFNPSQHRLEYLDRFRNTSMKSIKLQ